MKKLENLCRVLRLKIFVGLLLVAFLGGNVLPALAIMVCHDYALYRVTGKDPRPKNSSFENGTGFEELRKRLKALGFDRFPITSRSHNSPEEGRAYLARIEKSLRPGDVILLRNDHSGYVNENGGIDHFIQVYGTTTKKEIFRYDARVLPRHPLPDNKIGGLYLGDTLQQFLSRPFYKGEWWSLEVWRRGTADISGTWNVTWTDPYAFYKTRWEIRSAGTNRWQVKHTLLDTNHGFNSRLKGQSWDDIYLTKNNSGKFIYKRTSTDTNPGNAGYFESTGVCTASGNTLACEGTHKGTILTHWFKIAGSR